MSAWLGLLLGCFAAFRDVTSHRFVDLGLFRLAVLHAENELNGAFRAVFLSFFPVLLLQQLLLRTLRMRPAFSLAIVLPLLAWSFSFTSGSLQGFWAPYLVRKLDPWFFPSLSLSLAMAILATFWPSRTSSAPRPVFRLAQGLLTGGIALLPALLFLNLGAALDGVFNRPKTPNVLLIVVDAMRADHMGTYGYEFETTPYLDELARESIVFKNAISVASWTTPSIGAMLTSRFPSELESRGKPQQIGNETAFISELFRNYNYTTYAFVSHYYIRGRMGFEQGFDLYDESEARGHRHISAASISNHAISFLEEKGNRPFFLFLHYFDPHSDYFEHPPYDFFPDYSGSITSGHAYRDLRALAPEMSREDLRFVRALYDSEIRFTDSQIQRVLERLKELGLYENTLIAFTTDHGEEFCERGDFYIGHGTHLYQELIHVPLFLKLPGSNRQRVVSDPVSTIDLAPTLAYYAGLDSFSQLPFRGKPIRLHADLLEDASDVISEHGSKRTLVSGSWKLHLDLRKRTEELYDLSIDPGESNDLATKERETVLRLRHRIRAHEARIGPHRLRKVPALPEFSAEETEQLKAMGYIE